MKGVRKTREGTWQVFVKRQGQYRSRRFPAETALQTLKTEREKLIGEILHQLDEPEPVRTFAEEADEYLTLVTAMPSYADRVYRIRRWVEVFGPRDRKSITAREIAAVLERWRRTGSDQGGPLANASLNQRLIALKAMYTKLDGRSAANIVKDVARYDERDSERIRAQPLLDIARVIRRLRPGSQTRARLRVLMWTGWPHALLKGIQPDDIDWTRGRVRLGRRKKGKGMPAAWVPVVPRAMLALRRFADLACWGAFSNSSMHSAFARALAAENRWRMRHEQPTLPHIRVYDIKHSMATWAAGIVKDDRALKELLRTNSVARYIEGALAQRLEDARAQLAYTSRHGREKTGAISKATSDAP